MTKELTSIDISKVPDLLRVAEDVRATNTPQVLRRDHEALAVVVPIAAPRTLVGPIQGSVLAALAAGFQSVPALPPRLSVEELVEIAAEEHAQAVAAEGA